ncbi:cleavage and polyadenylation specificity factor subunit 3-like isoform X2 [Gordionus sp. m RMFG-2023]|uniref:cleavage and polyadenylation specificity factor subunit 3-like isoform X2 n=1 Tax=Gordionus sp. m RMFG-2023 TaxID=3053472 RepID=UPI0031FC2483
MTARLKFESNVSQEEKEQFIIKPLGAGQEVGRSCIIIEFKGKKIMLDCGIHPGLMGMDALPYVDFIDADEIDLLLVSHFHLDHCGALPWFLEKTTFRGRCFMTHASKAIYRWLLSDYVRVSASTQEQMLFTEEDLEKSTHKIETINFHEEKEVNGIRFKAYMAGHVLGAAMFFIEIAGVKLLYTGDFSRVEDRHLMAAEIPSVRPDILITESTYGTHIHEDMEEREKRFTSLVHDITYNRGGRCLIPVFALGRAQELMLILDEYWRNHPELNDIPIYYASSLAKKCMNIFQTYINSMNEKIRKQIAHSPRDNPFAFKHIKYLKSLENFEDLGPCVVLASPGMLQNGISRELFESWCSDHKNGTIIAGYCVEGTLAKSILSEPDEITAMNGQRLPLRCSVDYISFSAHTDYKQTSEFVRLLKPAYVILVHGEQNEMYRLKAALIREYEDDPDNNIEIFNPRNTQAVELYFRGEKMAKIVGTLAMHKPKPNQRVTGILVKRNFNYHIMDSKDINNYTGLTVNTVTQRMTVPFTGSVTQLKSTLCPKFIARIEKEPGNEKFAIKLFDGNLSLTLEREDDLIILEWESSALNDMRADALIACILKQETSIKRHLTRRPFRSGIIPLRHSINYKRDLFQF